MDSQTKEIVNKYTEELYALLNAETVEEALYGLITYLGNGLRILNEVVLRLEDRE